MNQYGKQRMLHQGPPLTGADIKDSREREDVMMQTVRTSLSAMCRFGAHYVVDADGEWNRATW